MTLDKKIKIFRPVAGLGFFLKPNVSEADSSNWLEVRPDISAVSEGFIGEVKISAKGLDGEDLSLSLLGKRKRMMPQEGSHRCCSGLRKYPVHQKAKQCGKGAVPSRHLLGDRRFYCSFEQRVFFIIASSPWEEFWHILIHFFYH